jgi:TatD DNase family protein
MLRSEKSRAVVAHFPRDRVLTETDGPFVEREGRPVRPRDVVGTVSELAAVRGISAGDMARIVVENLSKLVTA